MQSIQDLGLSKIQNSKNNFIIRVKIKHHTKYDQDGFEFLAFWHLHVGVYAYICSTLVGNLPDFVHHLRILRWCGMYVHSPQYIG